MRRLENKVALISGARRGIGRGIALCFAEEGADVLIGDVVCDDESLSVIKEIEDLGRRARFTQVDVSVREQVDAWVKDGVQQCGRLDIAVANAAYTVRQPFAEAQWSDIEKTIAVTQFGVFHTCQFAARQMIQQGKGGKIIVIGSIHAEQPFANSAAYDMAKAAINHLVGTMALELAPHRINVNAINPGWIDTPGERQLATEERLRHARQIIPWGRLGTPRDIGRCAAFLASDDADYMTGSCVRVDGGRLVGLSLPSPPPSPE